jgi:hypothetical protein
MFHYFKFPYFTCTFFTKFTYNEYIGPYFLLHVVLQFSPVNSSRVDTVSPPTLTVPRIRIKGWLVSPTVLWIHFDPSPQKNCVCWNLQGPHTLVVLEMLHEFEVPWHKPCPMTLGNIYAWIWVFSVSTTGDGSTTALPICIEVEDQGWKACQNPEATQAIKGRWSTYMCAHFKHQTQEMIMFAHRLTSSF